MSDARILIVDDEPGMLRSVERILGRTYTVHASVDPREALETAATFRPDLAVVDIQMPHLDGFTLLHELKQLDPGMMVILMTGSVFEVDDQLVRAVREEAFYYIIKPFDRGVLLALVERALELRELEVEQARHLARLEKQLEQAAAFQRAMLPPTRAEHGNLRIAAAHWPSEEVAGDLYDYVTGEDDTLAVLVADVVGHGASAAMLTALVKSAFRGAHGAGYDPLEVMRRAHEAIRVFEADRFVTVIAGRITGRPGARTLEVVNAGHNGGFLRRPDGSVFALEATGPIVSPVWPEARWEVAREPWIDGMELLFYSDGIPEASQGDRDFGEDRLRDLLAVPGDRAGLLHRIRTAVTEFAPSAHRQDDITLLHVYGG